MGIAISAITMVSGFAAMSGNPVGFTIAMVLNSVKTILNIIDKHNKGPPESESSKLQKAIEKALRKFTETELNADWNGYQRLTDVYLKHLEMIQSFDKVEDLKDATFSIEDKGDKEEVKQQLFDEVTPQIYKVLVSSTHLLGKVEHYISKVCDFDIQTRKIKKMRMISVGVLRVKNYEKEPIPKEEEITEKDSFATDCLKLYELYSKISTYHYTTYLKSLEVVGKIVGTEYHDASSDPESQQNQPTDSSKQKNPNQSTGTKNNEAKQPKSEEELKKKEAKEEKSRRKAYVFLHLLLDMIKNSREYNKKVFKPFLNPFEHYKMRYTVNFYYNNAKKYEHLTTYLKDFYTDDETMKTTPKKVMFCSQQSLLGSCYLEKGTKAQPGPWRSAYVPKGKSITVQYQDQNKQTVNWASTKGGRPIKLIGPSAMGMLFTMEMQPKTKDVEKLKKNDYGKKAAEMQKFDKYVKQITISDEKEPAKDDNGKPTKPPKKLYRMCVTRDYLQENPRHHASVCITDEFQGVKIIHLNEVKSPTTWIGKNISLSCSEPDLAFVGLYKEGTENFRWGPFFSPFPMMQLPGSVRWSSIKVYPYKNEDESTVKALTDADKDDVCKVKKENNLLCQEKTIDKKLFVTICKQAEMKGYCEEIPVLKDEITGTNTEKKVELIVVNGDGMYAEKQKGTVKGKEYKTVQKIETEDEPKGTKMFEKTFKSYHDVDNSLWVPKIEDTTINKAIEPIEKVVEAAAKPIEKVVEAVDQVMKNNKKAKKKGLFSSKE